MKTAEPRHGKKIRILLQGDVGTVDEIFPRHQQALSSSGGKMDQMPSYSNVNSVVKMHEMGHTFRAWYCDIAVRSRSIRIGQLLPYGDTLGKRYFSDR
jgi:hypothetical protein